MEQIREFFCQIEIAIACMLFRTMMLSQQVVITFYSR